MVQKIHGQLSMKGMGVPVYMASISKINIILVQVHCKHVNVKRHKFYIKINTILTNLYGAWPHTQTSTSAKTAMAIKQIRDILKCNIKTCV